MSCPAVEMPALLCLLARRAATVRVGPREGIWVVGFGGPGAIATTVLGSLSAPPELVGVVAAVPVPAEPAADLGESASLFEPLPEVGVVALV